MEEKNTVDVKLEAPKNALIDIINKTVDQLLLGIGEKVVIAQVTALYPWLGLPVISTIFSICVYSAAKSLNSGLKNNIDIIVIRYQNDARKKEYDEAIERLKKETELANNKEESERALKAAREAMDRLINRNKN